MKTVLELPYHRFTDVVHQLNDIGVNVVIVDGVFYSYIEFTPSDNDTLYHTVVGKDITSLIHSIVTTHGFTHLEKTNLLQNIEAIDHRRREFHPSIIWAKYAAKGSR